MTSTPFTCDQFDALLPDLLDGTIDAAARDTADAHVAGCARCRNLVADLEEIRDEAARLPVLKPSRDLWSGISARIRTPVTRHPSPVTRWFSSPTRLAAAAVLLVAATSSVTWTIATRRAPEAGTGTAPSAANAGTGISASSRVAMAYDNDLSNLATLVADRAGSLDSATAREVAASMRTIDDAIAHVRAALDANPNSALLSRQLAHAYQRKVSTLRRIAELSAE